MNLRPRDTDASHRVKDSDCMIGTVTLSGLCSSFTNILLGSDLYFLLARVDQIAG